MNRKFVFLFSLFLFSKQVQLFSQTSLLTSNIDTLTYAHRIGGPKIDSLDWIQTSLSNTLPSGANQSPWGRFGTDYSNFHSLFSQAYRIEKPINPRFSALPHVGFAYSFGSFSTQFLQAEYNQTFRKNNHLAIQFARNSMGEAIRNNAFKNNTLQINWVSDLKKYKQQTSVHSFQSERFLSGGISDLSIIESQGIEFAPIFKQNAKSNVRHIELSSQHYLALIGDSLKQSGLVYHGKLNTSNRIYTESDLLSTIYASIYIDSFQTRDQYQESNLKQSAGVFLNLNSFKTEILATYHYRGFQNLGTFKDTTELGLTCNTQLSMKNMKIKNLFHMYFVGAKGEFSEQIHIELPKFKTLNHSLNILLEHKLPTLFQRSYFSNNATWKTTDLKLQKNTQIAYRLNFGKNNLIELHSIFNTFSDKYQLINDVWRNDTLANWMHWCNAARINLSYKTLHFQPAIHFNYTNLNPNILPSVDLRARLFWNKKLFKAKKFDFIAGIDARYISSYSMMQYDTRFDLYRIDNVLNISTTPIVRFDFFTGFQLDEFRFYFKFENLDYFWNQKTLMEQQNFPLSPNVLRLGLTWDFFN